MTPEQLRQRDSEISTEELVLQSRLKAYKRPSARFVHEVMPAVWLISVIALGGFLLYHFVTRG